MDYWDKFLAKIRSLPLDTLRIFEHRLTCDVEAGRRYDHLCTPEGREAGREQAKRLNAIRQEIATRTSPCEECDGMGYVERDVWSPSSETHGTATSRCPVCLGTERHLSVEEREAIERQIQEEEDRMYAGCPEEP
jgi:hypothetical protein